MKVDTKYGVGDRLFITDNGNVQCRVLEIIISRGGITYQVEYWNNGEVKAVRLYEDELELEPEGKKVGL